MRKQLVAGFDLVQYLTDGLVMQLIQNRTDPSQPAMPFIVGAARSGTTLLRLMLDAHSALSIPPETGFVVPVARIVALDTRARQKLFNRITQFPHVAPAWQDFGIDQVAFYERLVAIPAFNTSKGVRSFYEMYATRHGKHRWGDKTPYYCRKLCLIERLLPEAHFIHIIRDGRDVALSLREMWFAPGKDMPTLAKQWRNDIVMARRQGQKCKHYLEVRYEQLIENTKEVLTQICEFIQLSYEPKMEHYYETAATRLSEHQGRFRTDGHPLVTQTQRLQQQRNTMRPPDRSRIGTWHQQMTASEQRAFERVSGALLRELGY